MPETPKSPCPPNPSEAVVLDKISTLEAKIEYMARTKRKTAIATYVGLIICIVFIALFLFHLFSFAKNYNTVELTAALNLNTIELIQSKESQEVVQVLGDKFLPALKTALIQKMQEDAPQFRKSTQELTLDLSNYMENQMKPKLATCLVKELATSEALMLKTYSKSKPSLERINSIILNTHSFLLPNVTQILDLKLNKALFTLSDLNNSFQEMYASMENSPSLKGLTPEMTGEVQSRLIETLLEIIIYNLNPEKGNMPAFANGGTK